MEAGPGRAQGILEVADPPEVDGRIEAAWDTVPELPLARRDGSVLGHVRLAYDSTALYAALTVPDDTVVFPNRSWRFGDGFYLTVLMPETGSASAQHISLGLSRVGGRLETVVVNRSGEYFPRHTLAGLRLAMRPAPGATPGLSEAASPWHDDVTYEVAVPWSILAPADPLTIDSLAVNVVVVDRDGGTDREFGQLTPDPGFDTERTPVRRGRLLPLLRRQSSGSDLAIRVGSPIVSTDSSSRVVVAVRGSVPGEEAPAEAGLKDDERRVVVELVRGGRVLAAREVTFPGGDGAGIRRATVSLTGLGANTGPATVRAREGDRMVEHELMLIDPGQLDRIRARLARIPAGAPVAAAVPTALYRLERLAARAEATAVNAPIGPVVDAWAGLVELVQALAAGSVAPLRTPGLHQVAHRSQDNSLQPYSVYLPDRLPAGPAPLLVALHGSGVTETGTARAVGPAAAERGWVVAAPRGRGLSDWYVGAAETDVLEVMDHVAQLYPVDPARVVLAGFSMGGYGTWRLVLRHADRFRAAVVMAGARCPFEPARGACVDTLLDRRPPAQPRPPVLVLHGAQDNAVPVEAARQIVERLERVGWPVEYVEIPDAGHGGRGWWARAVAWLGNALRRSSP